MKKVLKIILCIVVVIILIGGSVCYAMLPHPLNYNINGIQPVGTSLKIVAQDDHSVTVQKTENNSFKILMFTDMHLDGKNKTSRVTVSHLVENIQKEKPDLVLLGGDNVTSGLNRKRSHQLAEIFEKLGVYWGGIIGNHEGDNSFSIKRNEMVGIFSSYKHCLMRKGLDSVSGDCNYSLRILNPDGTMRFTFFCLDTYDCMSDEQKTAYSLPLDESFYDGVREDQVDWFKSEATEIKSQYGDYACAVLIHIPLPQYSTAAETQQFRFGGKLENVCCSGFEPGLFDAIKSTGNPASVFCGHDHLNNFGVEYQDVLLSYIEPSGYGSYTTQSTLGYEEKDWLQGYTRLDLQQDGSFEQTQVRNSAAE